MVDQSLINVEKKRWLVLFLLMWLNLLYMFTYVNFTVVNNVFTAYFNTSYAAVDWIVLGSNLGTVLVAPMVTWLTLKQIISCKIAMITSSVFQFFNFLFIIIGFIRPSFFIFVVVGQVIGGVSFAFLLSVPTSLAQTWFPESQIGLATGLAITGCSTGGIFAYILPSQILDNPQSNNESFKNWKNYTNTKWFQHDQSAYQWLFLTMLFTVSLVIILLLTIVPQLPEQPPSVAQHLKRLHSNNKDAKAIVFLSFVHDIKNVTFDKTFVACVFTGSVTFFGIELYDLSIEALMQNMNHGNYNPEKLGGYLMALTTAGLFLGNIVSGLLLDAFKKYYLQSVISAVTSFFICAGIFLSAYFNSLTALFVVLFAFGLSSRIFYITTVDSLMQHTYPTDPLIVMSVFVFFQNIIAIIFIEIGRQIIYRAGLWLGLIYFCALMLLVVILSAVFKTKTERLKAESLQNSNASDEAPLLYTGF